MKARNGGYGRFVRRVIYGLFKVVLILVLLPFVLFWLSKEAKKKRLRKKELKQNIEIFDMAQIDALSGTEFEELLKKLFESQGYKATLTKKSHDYGADIIAEKKGKISVVQAKCYGHNVGIKAVQEIIPARGHYKANECFVATNRYFSKDATMLAIEHNVKLIDRDVLFSLVKRFKPTITVNAKKYSAILDNSVAEIEARYKYWI